MRTLQLHEIQNVSGAGLYANTIVGTTVLSAGLAGFYQLGVLQTTGAGIAFVSLASAIGFGIPKTLGDFTTAAFNGLLFSGIGYVLGYGVNAANTYMTNQQTAAA